MTGHVQEQIMAIDCCPETDLSVYVCVHVLGEGSKGTGAKKLLILSSGDVAFQNEGQLYFASLY
jgi:hypothetical protein